MTTRAIAHAMKTRATKRGASLKNRNRQPWLFRAMAHVLVVAMILGSAPELALAAVADKQQDLPPAPKVKVNRTVPKVTPAPQRPKFSSPPTDLELFQARVFEEPLVPSALTTADENQELGNALEGYIAAKSREDVSALEGYLRDHPNSPWTTSVLLGTGLVYRRTGHWLKALDAFDRAWQSGKDASEPKVQALANRAAGELAALDSRLGRMPELEKLFAETDKRNIGGTPDGLLSTAHEALHVMKTIPDRSFRCGPLAVQSIYTLSHPGVTHESHIEAVASTTRGTSLAQMQDLAQALGMDLHMARRGAGAEVPTPALIHWKAGHFAALLRQQGDRFLVRDPTFGSETWISKGAIDEEASGAFLVPKAALDHGWKAMTSADAATVWGKGVPHGPDPQKQGCGAPGSGGNGGGCSGMANYRFNTLLASLFIADGPLGYKPPVGPEVDFTVMYNQSEMFQPAVFNYSNLGPKWTFDWLSYVEDDPDMIGQTVSIYLGGGGQVAVGGINPDVGGTHPNTLSYHSTFSDNSTLTVTPPVVSDTGATPVHYELHFTDGSYDVYGAPDGSAVLPRKVFLTERHDPQGNVVKLTHDASMRVIAITDAIGQVTTVSYELPGDFYKITKITDPFGRSAHFDYDNAGHLAKITDVIGLSSSFGYGSNDFVSEMTTPYGTTHFATEAIAYPRWVQATDPLGGTERLEYHNNDTVPPDNDASVPAGVNVTSDFMRLAFSAFWTKRAMALAPGDLAHAVITHWFANPDAQATSVVRAFKRPLESRIWFQYPDQAAVGEQGLFAGSRPEPIKVGRFVDNPDGSGTPVSQVYSYAYNSLGHVTSATEPFKIVGGVTQTRTTTYVYDPNDIDMIEVRQTNPGSAGGYDVLAHYVYNDKHEPIDITDASGQHTALAFFPNGQIQTATNAKNETWTFAYTGGYFQSLTGPVAGATTTFTYDGYGRPRDITNADNYKITLDYDSLDRLTRVTYPNLDASGHHPYEELTYDRMHPAKYRDLLGRISQLTVDAMRRPLAVRDPLGRVTNLVWCTCGALDQIVDGNGNATKWTRDLQGRVTREVRADGTHIDIAYDATTSRVNHVTDAKGQVRAYRYFIDDSIEQVAYTNATVATPSISFDYDLHYARPSSRTDGTGTTTYIFNPIAVPTTFGAGRLASIDGPLGNDTVSYTYDELGRITKRSLNGVDTTLEYDSLNRITNVANALGAFTYGYDGNTHRLASVSGPNNLLRQYVYDTQSNNRQLKQVINKKAGGVVVSQFDYTRADDNTIKSWTRQTDSTPGTQYSYGLDATSQLTSATLSTTSTPPTVLKSYAYTYDRGMNRTSEQVDGVPMVAVSNSVNEETASQSGTTTSFVGTTSEAATVQVGVTSAVPDPGNGFHASLPIVGTQAVGVRAADSSGNVTTNTYNVTAAGSSAALTYDNNGNMLGDGTRTFEWDARDQLVAVNNGTHRTEFTYDGLGRRTEIVEKNAGVVASDKRYVWCGLILCEERDASGVSTTKRYFGQGVQDGGTSLYYTKDHLGSVREVLDAGANVRARYDYDPFGRRSKTAGDLDADLGFTGYYEHAGSGLKLAHYRAYDPNLGRWLSRDPHGFADGTNLYRYAGNDPVDRVDPLGLLSCFTQGMVASIPSMIGWAIIGALAVAAAPEVAILMGGMAVVGTAVAISDLYDTEDINEADYKAGQLFANSTGLLAGALAGGEVPDEEPEGIVYKRIDPNTGEEYVGQAKSDERFLERQAEHDRDLGVKHDYDILGRAEPGEDLDFLEEQMIRQNGGIQKEGGPLANKRHQMCAARYHARGGR